jgi:hypothetical protein
MRYRYAIGPESICNRTVIKANALCYLLFIAAHIALQSLCNRCVNASKAQHYSYAIAAQSLRKHLLIALQPMRYRYAIGP